MKKIALSLIMAAAPCTFAVSSVLDFSGLGLPDYGDIPDAYGDNWANTPNVAVDYRTVVPGTGATVSSNLDYWSVNYGDLVDVAFAVVNGNLGEISLVPEPGWNVTLESFDLAGYSQTDKPDQTVRILDENYNILLDYSPYDVEGDNGHSSFAPNITRAGIIRIQYGPDWNTGLDNVTFSQSRHIPGVPDAGGSLILLGLSSAVLCLARRARQ